jgi:hypothetical protein
LGAAGFPQQKILHDEFAVAAREWSAASAATHLTIIRLQAGFDFNDVVESLTIRAFEERLACCRKARRFANDSHGTPPVPLIYSILRGCSRLQLPPDREPSRRELSWPAVHVAECDIGGTAGPRG